MFEQVEISDKLQKRAHIVVKILESKIIDGHKNKENSVFFFGE